jgi:nucleotide-binding universal stress UspA family protein
MRTEPFSTVIVGVDGAVGGEDAIVLARALASHGSTVALVHVTPEDGEYDGGRGLLHAARGSYGGPCLTLLRAAADVGTGLRQVARDLSADLIVVGSPSPRPFAGGGHQPDLLQILHRAPCAVAIAPRGEHDRERRMERVGVAYRDTPSGHAALRLARDIAAERHARVLAMTVVPVLPSPWLGPTLGGASGAALLSGDAAESARDHLAGLPGVEGVVAEGDPAAQLTRFSRTVDLLIVGTRGHGALRRLLVGSTAEVLLTASACPVLVVPGGAVGAPTEGSPGSAAEPMRLRSR